MRMDFSVYLYFYFSRARFPFYSSCLLQIFALKSFPSFVLLFFAVVFICSLTPSHSFVCSHSFRNFFVGL